MNNSSSTNKRRDSDQQNKSAGNGSGSTSSSSKKSKNFASDGNQNQQQHSIGGGLMPIPPHPMQYMQHPPWGPHQQLGVPPPMMGMNGGQPVPQGPLHYMPPPPHMPQWGMFRQPTMGMPSDMNMSWQQPMNNSESSGADNEKEKKSSCTSPVPANRKSGTNSITGIKSQSPSTASNEESAKNKKSSNSATKSDSTNNTSRDIKPNQQLHMSNMMPPWAQTQIMMPGPNHIGGPGMPAPMMMGMMPTPDQMMMNNVKTGGNLYPQHMMSPEAWMGHPMGQQAGNRQGINGNANMLCKSSVNGGEEADLFMMKSPPSKGDKGRGNYRCGRVSMRFKGCTLT